ncbi:MAG: phospholipid carrier-dependent glycosyltransferase [Ardenticatenaceae bacterium]|nr:phospholipid carrier-dependent glycosyltransferase [Ardenticatenaceae bacterium]
MFEWQRVVTWRGTAVLLLLLLYALIITSVSQKSMTVDEQGHLFRGIAYVRTGATHFLWGHPLLASSLSALPLLTEPTLRLPTDSAVWQSGEWEIASDQFLWQINNNPLRLIFLGRLPTLWLTMLLAALLYRWGRELKGKKVAFLALALFAFDPNILAHGGLITSDIAVTFFMLLAIYGFWRWAALEQGTNRPIMSLLLVGTGIGGAAATKFSAAALVPILGLLGLVLAVKRRSWQPLLFLMAAGVMGLLTVWAVYGFQIRPFPAAAYWDDFVWQLDYFSRPHGAYLFGQFAETGWWYYFPITFLLKTSLPVLLLLVIVLAGLVFNARRRVFVLGSLNQWVLVGPTAVYFLISLFTPLNIGYRHLLPILPFLYLFFATNLPFLTIRRLPVPLIFALWLLGVAVLAWPNYIPYFNWAAGRPENRWQLLSDSNLDWGQDLPALARWQNEHGVPLYLSYFGTAHPSAYGLNFTALPTWEPGPEQIPLFRQTFDPQNPAPGFYAISVTNLQGLVLGDASDTFAWFRQQTPIARIGESIFVYEVAAAGLPVDVAFSGLRPAELAPELAATLQSNDVRVRWFDSRTSLIWPASGGWWAVAADQPMNASLQPLVQTGETFTVADGHQQLLRPIFTSPDLNGQPVPMGETAVFLGYQEVQPDQPPNQFSLITGWQVAQATERPLKIFVHALDATGELLGQWDGLDVDPGTWQPGDVFVQLHQFAVPEGTAVHAFAIGLYDGITLERLAEPVIIRRELGEE